MPIQTKRFVSSNAIKLEIVVSGPALRFLQGHGTLRDAALSLDDLLTEALEEVDTEDSYPTTLPTTLTPKGVIRNV